MNRESLPVALRYPRLKCLFLLAMLAMAGCQEFPGCEEAAGCQDLPGYQEATRCHDTTGCQEEPRPRLLGHGERWGDTRLPPGDEVSSPPLHLRTPVVLYSQRYAALHINMNGFISLDGNWPSFFNIEFPFRSTLIAPLFCDVDTTANGTVWYRETEDPQTLSELQDHFRKVFSAAANFWPTGAVVATWESVPGYGLRDGKTNYFQVAVASDGRESFASLRYAAGGVQWLRGARRDALQRLHPGRPTVLAQAALLSDDGRSHLLPGSGRYLASSLDRRSNTGEPGVWAFRIGKIFAAENVEEPDLVAPPAEDPCLACHPAASCEPAAGGACCRCPHGTYGNGVSCISVGGFMQTLGSVSGSLDGEPLSGWSLAAHTNLEEGGTHTTLEAVHKNFEHDVQLLLPFVTGTQWLFSRRLGESDNGFGITGGFLSRHVKLHFPNTGHNVSIQQEFKGLNAFDELMMDTSVAGSLPPLPRGTSAGPQLEPFAEYYTLVADGRLRAQFRATFILPEQSEELPVTVDTTLEFGGCLQQRTLVPSAKLTIVGGVFVSYDAAQRKAQHACSTEIQAVPEEPCAWGRSPCGALEECALQEGLASCLCARGYERRGAECADVDECLDHPCDELARCDNVPGSYVCTCAPGLVGEGNTCARPLSHRLYAHAEAAHDSRLPPGDEAASGELRLRTPVVFYGRTYRSLYVNMNGFISFDQPMPGFMELVFPFHVPMIAALYSDVDTTANGSVWFRETQHAPLLKDLRNTLRGAFSAALNFQPKNAVVATWERVPGHGLAAGETNYYQVVIVSDGQESFVLILYADGGVQWLKGGMRSYLFGIKKTIDTRPMAQAGLQSDDDRIHLLPGFGSPHAHYLDRRGNLAPGVWAFHVGRTYLAGEPDRVAPPAEDPCLACHPAASCEPAAGGACCRCPHGTYGNGGSCVAAEEPLHMEGHMSGYLIGYDPLPSKLKAMALMKDGTTFTSFSDALPDQGYNMQLLLPLATGPAWLFAQPLNGSQTGFTQHGDYLKTSVILHFHKSGHILFVNQAFQGLDPFGKLRMDTTVSGSLPGLPGAYYPEVDPSTLPSAYRLEVDPFVEHYTLVAEGRMRARTNLTFRIEELQLVVPATMETSLEFMGCHHQRAHLPSVKFSVEHVLIAYDEAARTVRYSLEATTQQLADDACTAVEAPCGQHEECVVEAGLISCLCARGFERYDGRCADVDECREQPCGLYARCDNVPGGFLCSCEPGYVGDGYTCTPPPPPTLELQSGRCLCPHGFSFFPSEASNVVQDSKEQLEGPPMPGTDVVSAETSAESMEVKDDCPGFCQVLVAAPEAYTENNLSQPGSIKPAQNVSADCRSSPGNECETQPISSAGPHYSSLPPTPAPLNSAQYNPYHK